ncbi:MAG: 1-deoxy-D-xylulose-5-phosphate synthase [Endomicrobiia bacterium]|nr:1-deoxy-D-xylulose-5-phosphate synthase [Endomicrobiaceae bacterium]MDD3053550.1 1-deoxy-D-xylulose-5-phosphate synthase [Endomicrobiaceae bacterium]MDD3922345.1 1-deoxy-D-xylulose-5-phosphate synthase [Endomicrobiaceae bacterium]MDD5101619.1 1-deoxy-D-xylulose-5-phosphate synthase [Endomicrobiaceae bacterium]
MSILEKISKPSDLKIIKKELLPQLADEIREELIKIVSQNGGHLASSLGVVELTIALHYCFNVPKDKFIWDVGHQAYAHKILTGRRDKFHTLRQYNGLSGFPKISESVYDAFGVGHSSTSISAALGFSVSRDLQGEDYKVVSIIGDGSMTGGLAFEGLQNAGTLAKDMLVILNDNQMFISKKVGVLAGHFAKLLTAGSVKKIEDRVKKFVSRIKFWGLNSIKIVNRFKVMLFPGMLFEEMGFTYIGPIDGHNINSLIDILSNVKELKGPVLLHVITKKGKGYKPAEEDPTKFHGVGPFDITTGKTSQTKKITYTEVFSKALVKLARKDNKIIAVTAAMPDGTGVKEFSEEFPERFFDVGIAEGHAITFAAAMAAGGLKPICAIYSTFMQRALDNIIHDVALQNLPVVMILDRAGIVGEDGATHHGVFDMSYLKYIPNLTIMSPANEIELQDMLNTAVNLKGPSVIRYPRGTGTNHVDFNRNFEILDIGKSKLEKYGEDICLITIGNPVNICLEVANKLEEKNIKVSVVNMRFLKPFDENEIKNIFKYTKKIITVEENSLIGGMGETVKSILSGTNAEIFSIGIPDIFIEHGAQNIIRDKYGLSVEKIEAQITKMLSKSVNL